MYSIYRVEEGDTLETVAQKVGTDVDTLRKINGLAPGMSLFVGGYILVPNTNKVPSINGTTNNTNSDLYDTYIVKQGDNVYAIARQYSVPYETILKINGLDDDDYIYPNQQLLIPRKENNLYITKNNDTIQSIYEKYGNRWEQFLSENQNIYVQPDQVIMER